MDLRTFGILCELLHTNRRVKNDGLVTLEEQVCIVLHVLEEGNTPYIGNTISASPTLETPQVAAIAFVFAALLVAFWNCGCLFIYMLFSGFLVDYY